MPGGNYRCLMATIGQHVSKTCGGTAVCPSVSCPWPPASRDRRSGRSRAAARSRVSGSRSRAALGTSVEQLFGAHDGPAPGSARWPLPPSAAERSPMRWTKTTSPSSRPRRPFPPSSRGLRSRGWPAVTPRYGAISPSSRLVADDDESRRDRSIRCYDGCMPPSCTVTSRRSKRSGCASSRASRLPRRTPAGSSRTGTRSVCGESPI